MKKICFCLLGCLLLFSCSDEFLKENNTIMFENGIVLSPNTGNQTFRMYNSGLGNRKFSVVSSPDWLNIVSISEKFDNSEAIIICNASYNADFTTVGIYNDFIILNIEGVGKCRVLVQYIEAGNPSIQTNEEISIDYTSYYGSASLTINNTGEGILVWQVMSCPEWITINNNNNNILPQYATGNANITFNLQDIALTGKLTGDIVIVSNDKERPQVTVKINVSFGTPSLSSVDNADIKFRRGENTQYFGFSNQGNGLLIWSIEDLPEWLSVSEETNGTLYAYGWQSITLTCNRNLMPMGVHSAVIYLKTNDEKQSIYPININVQGGVVSNAENIKIITGNVIDGCFDKQTDVLYILTSQPNRLLVYDVKEKRMLHEIELAKIPTCLTVSEDGTKAAIGHSGMISAVNLNDFSITTADIAYNVYDIAWTDGDSYTYTQKGGDYVPPHSINMITGMEINYEGNYYNMHSETSIRKVPNKPYVIAARRTIHPSGIITYNINTRSQKNYIHNSIGNFWFSTDGTYLFDSYGQVYQTESVATLPDVAGFEPFYNLKLSENPNYYYNSINWIDYGKNNLWALYEYTIYKLDATDYNVKEKLYYSEYYIENSQEHYVTAQYLFANSDETELTLIEKVEDNNTWLLEFISLNP